MRERNFWKKNFRLLAITQPTQTNKTLCLQPEEVRHEYAIAELASLMHKLKL